MFWFNWYSLGYHIYFWLLNSNGFLLSEPEASSEESPSADEEQAASSAATAEVEEAAATGETEPTENGEKAEGAEAEKDGEGTEKKEWVSPESQSATLNTAIFHYDSTFICLYDPYLCWMTADCSSHGCSVAFPKDVTCHSHIQ